MDFCLGIFVKLTSPIVFVVLGAFKISRTVRWVVGRIGLVIPRWATNGPLLRSAEPSSVFEGLYHMLRV
eukprot:8120326-Alexandrium_andersonii.AAC.1